MRIFISSFLFLFGLASTTASAAEATAPASYQAYQPAPASSVPPATVGSSGTAAPGGAAPALRGASVWGMLPWGGLGVGARMMMPLAISPLLHNTSLRDSFSLEFGADYLHFSHDYGYGVHFSHNELLPVVGAMWNVWFSDQFAIYPKAEIGYAFAWISDLPYGQSSSAYGYGGVFFSGAAGALYKPGNGLTFRAEAGVSGLKLGVGWLF